jgi:voltage-gated potassium channel Kch
MGLLQHYTPILKIDKNLNDKLNELQYISKGFPVSFSDNYWRMFYFSTITVTTLGYGDIVPLTNKARLIVSTEAVLGVVVIGLFLNSLSKRFYK